MLQAPLYPRQHKIQITHQLFIAKTDDPVALRFQPSSAAGIGCKFFRRFMGGTINLNQKPCLTAAEISKERADGNLAGKFHATELAVAQAGPEFGFGCGLIAAERPCAGGGLLIWASHMELVA